VLLRSAPPQHEKQQDRHRHRKTDARFIFPVFTVERPRKSFRRRHGWRKPRPECGDTRSVLDKRVAVMHLKLGLLPPNHDRIKNREIRGQQQRGNPGVARHRKSGGKEHASQIQRIPSEGVGPRSCKLLVLAEVSGSIAAQQQPANRNAHAAEQPLHLRTRKPERGDANRVSHADAPANPKVCFGTQAGTFKSAWAAASASSTVIRSIAGE